MYPGDYLVALSVSVALFATVLLAKTVGGLLPLVAKAMKQDPAIMAAPVITTIVDALSLIIYFTIIDFLIL
jgi:magnesium transporter